MLGVGILDVDPWDDSMVGEAGSSSLMAACSMVVKRPLFLGLKLRTGIAGGGDFLSGCLGGLSRVELLDIGNVWLSLDEGDMTGNPMV